MPGEVHASRNPAAVRVYAKLLEAAERDLHRAALALSAAADHPLAPAGSAVRYRAHAVVCEDFALSARRDAGHQHAWLEGRVPA